MNFLWIPVTIAAAFFQNLRSSLQRHLKGKLSDMGATYVRFAFAWPFAVIWLAVLVLGFNLNLPQPNLAFVGWVIAGSITQIIFTFLLIWLFSLSNFAVGTTLSKTEVLQVALLEAILLREAVTPLAAGAIVVSSIGVLALSAGKDRITVGGMFRGLSQKSTLIGLACGFFLGASSVLFRGAALSLNHDSLLTSAAFTLVLATLLQTILVTIWLITFEKGQISSVIANWRVAATVGFAGWIASICWFTAFTLTNAAYVRALGQVELIFTFLVSALFFREKVTRAEIGGAILLASGIVILILERVT
jgi:drug/metabolite transporter (DMT)-like permease